MARRIGLIAFIALVFSFAVTRQTAECQTLSHKDELQASSVIAPPFITPSRNVFVTREDEQFVVAVTASCLLEDDSEAQFELSPSSPDFVHVSDVYRRQNSANGYTEGLALVYVTPQLGDAGKHVVTLQVKACSGRVERVITFTVKVRPSKQP